VGLTFGRLEKEGIAKERLAAVHAPIGLRIGARTAEEIGISVVAELISIRRAAYFKGGWVDPGISGRGAGAPVSPRRRKS